MSIPLSPYVPEKLVSRDGFGSPLPRQPAPSPHSGCIWCLLTRFLPSSAAASIYLYKTAIRQRVIPELTGSPKCLYTGSLPRVRRHRASTPQGSSERVLPWQVTTDQLICAPLSHAHYWYEVGILEVPVSDSIPLKPATKQTHFFSK